MKVTAYQKQMDELQVPKEKAEETLRLMLEENRRLRQAEEKKSAVKSFGKRIPMYALAAAACLAIVFLSVRQFTGAQSPFLSVKISELPVAELSRGSETVSFRDVFGCEAETLFPDWAVDDEGVDTVLVQGSRMHEAYLTLRKDTTALSAVVSDYEPSLLTALKSGGAHSAGGIYLAKDTDSDALFAAYETEWGFVVLRAEKMSEGEFKKTVEDLQ